MKGSIVYPRWNRTLGASCGLPQGKNAALRLDRVVTGILLEMEEGG